MRYAFLNQDNIVVNTIVGELTAQQQTDFLRDYSVLFGATQIVAVDDDSVAIWSGGTYADGQFLPPPQPEPAPVVIEGTSEELPPLEVLDDALPS
jgi:hypothetical protein